MPVALLAGPIFLARVTNDPGPLILDGTLVLLGIASIGLYLRNERFMADRSSVSRVDFLGRTRTWPLSAVDRVDRFTLRGRYANFPYMAFLDAGGKALLTLTGQYWDTAQVEAICNQVGLRLTGDFSEAVSVFELHRRLGRTTNRRLVLMVVFVVLGAAAAALVFTLVTNGH